MIGNDPPLLIGDLDPTNDFTVSVNGGPEIQYVDFGGLIVNALSGDDDIDVELNQLNLLADIAINGNLPGTSGGDQLTVRGTAGVPDFINYDHAANTINVNGEVITVGTVEELIVDGEGDDEGLFINDSAGNDNYVHTPGAAINSGSFAISTGGVGQLGISYANFGANAILAVFGINGGTDALTVEGTAGDDRLVADGLLGVQLFTPAGTRAPIGFIGIEVLTLSRWRR